MLCGVLNIHSTVASLEQSINVINWEPSSIQTANHVHVVDKQVNVFCKIQVDKN